MSSPCDKAATGFPILQTLRFGWVWTCNLYWCVQLRRLVVRHVWSHWLRQRRSIVKTCFGFRYIATVVVASKMFANSVFSIPFSIYWYVCFYDNPKKTLIHSMCMLFCILLLNQLKDPAQGLFQSYKTVVFCWALQLIIQDFWSTQKCRYYMGRCKG